MLRKATGLPVKKVKLWLAEQALWQVHMPPPKKIDNPHYYVTEVNKMHQADLAVPTARQGLSKHVQVHAERDRRGLSVQGEQTSEDEEGQRGCRHVA